MASNEIPKRDTQALTDAPKPPRDRDQSAISPARAHAKADAAEFPTTPGTVPDERLDETLASRDNLEGTSIYNGPSEAEQADDRARRIAEAAYYRAQRRGFAPGGEDADWFEAEQELEQRGPTK